MEDAVAISLVARTSFKEAFQEDFEYADDLLAYQDQTFNVAKIGEHSFKIGRVDFDFWAMRLRW